jgi:hypothetical protein
VQKAGSYSVQLVTEAGESRLEFAIESGGQRHRVLSRETVTAGSWYQFAAHFRNGQLALAFGKSDLIALADVAGAADLSTEPIVIGSGFSGQLDEIALYDLSKPAFVTFADGTTETVITLDDQGRGSVDVVAVNTEPAAGGFGGGDGMSMRAAAAAQAVPVNYGKLAFASQLRQPAVRTYSPQPDNETYGSRLRVELIKGTENCLEGIATGEGELWSQQTACDIFAGLLPFTSFPMAARDLAVSGTHLVEGKRDIGKYVKATFALVVLVSTAVPGIKTLGRVLGEAHAAAIGTKAEGLLAREAMERFQQAYDLPPEQVRTSGMARVLGAGNGDKEAQEAMLAVVTACSVGSLGRTSAAAAASCRPFNKELMRLFNEAGGDAAHEALVKSVARIAKDSNFGPDFARKMIRTLGALQAEMGVTLKLSNDAVDGLAIFLKRVPAETRLPNIWEELKVVQELTDEKARKVIERLFVMVKQGEDRFDDVPGWQAYFGRGAGTGPIYHPTRGFFHSLERLLDESGTLLSVDSKFSFGNLFYSGRPDAIVRRLGKLVQVEYKALAEGSKLASKDLRQLKRNILAAIKRSYNRGPDNLRKDGIDVDLLKDELKRLEYVIRGAGRENEQVIIDQIRQAAREVLRDKRLSIARGPGGGPVQGNVGLSGLTFA